MRSFLMLFCTLTGLAVAAPLPEHTDLLAQNTVVARYIGQQNLPCHYRTADCPDRCGHAVKAAVFQVLSNEDYQKPGKYGDNKMEEGEMVYVDTQADLPGEPEAVRQELQHLTPGETVRLTITHYYLNGERVSEPVRPVTAFERVAPPDGKPLPPLPGDPDEGIMPL